MENNLWNCGDYHVGRIYKFFKTKDMVFQAIKLRPYICRFSTRYEREASGWWNRAAMKVEIRSRYSQWKFSLINNDMRHITIFFLWLQWCRYFAEVVTLLRIMGGCKCWWNWGWCFCVILIFLWRVSVCLPRILRRKEGLYLLLVFLWPLREM